MEVVLPGRRGEQEEVDEAASMVNAGQGLTKLEVDQICKEQRELGINIDYKQPSHNTHRCHHEHQPCTNPIIQVIALEFTECIAMFKY